MAMSVPSDPLACTSEFSTFKHDRTKQHFHREFKPVGNMKLSGAAWAWVGTTLHESAQIWRALGIHAMDLIAFPAAGAGIATIEADPPGSRDPDGIIVQLMQSP